jgi:hypothetical protein
VAAYRPGAIPLRFRYLDPTLSEFSFPLPGIECRSKVAIPCRRSPPAAPTGSHFFRPVGSDLLGRRTNLLSPSVALLPVFKVPQIYSPQRCLAAPDRCSGSRQTPVADEAGVSKRPFAPPGRLPISRPPLRHRRFRPASLTPCRFPPATRSAAGSLPRIRFPVAGKITACSPLPPLDRYSGRLPGPCSPSGPFDPSGSTLSPVHLRKLAFAYRSVPFAPRWSKL